MLKEIDKDIWTLDGPNVVFAGASMHTRMTIVRLSSGELWIHSPIVLDAEVKSLVATLGGTVCALIAPNKFHHMFVEQWRAAYPNAKVFAEEHVRRKIPALADSEELSNATPVLYSDDIDQTIFTGNRLFQEAVFFHKSSRSLILTDLMINLKTDHVKFLPRLFLKFEGGTYPNGGLTRLYRWFTNDKDKAREAVEVIRDWNPKRILFCHGEPFSQPAEDKLREEFAFLHNN